MRTRFKRWLGVAIFLLYSTSAFSLDSQGAKNALQPQFIVDGDYMNIYFNVKYEDNNVDNGYGVDGVFDHVHRVVVSWDGKILYAIEHIALSHADYQGDFAVNQFTDNLFSPDTFREYTLQTLGDDIQVFREEALAHGGTQRVTQNRIRVRIDALWGLDHKNITSRFNVSGYYHLRAPDRSQTFSVDDNLSQSHTVYPNVEQKLQPQFFDRGDYVDVYFNAEILDEDGTEEEVYDHLAKLDIAWAGQTIYALEHRGLYNEYAEDGYVKSNPSELMYHSSGDFNQWVKKGMEGDIELFSAIDASYGGEYPVAQVRVKIPKKALGRIQGQAELTDELSLSAEWYERGSGNGKVDAGVHSSPEFTVIGNEEDGYAYDELDFNVQHYTNEGYVEMSMRLETRAGEVTYDVVGCLEIHTGYGVKAQIKHNYFGDCKSLNATYEETLYGTDGDTYSFRAEGGAGEFLAYTEAGADGDVLLKIKHYYPAEARGIALEYYAHGFYYTQSPNGDGYQEDIAWWNLRNSIDTGEGYSLPSVTGFTADVSASDCQVELAWNAYDSFGDADRNKVGVYRNGELLLKLDPKVATTYVDKDIEAGVDYDYQVKALYERDAYGDFVGSPSAAISRRIELLDAPSGLVSSQTTCSGDITIDWQWNLANPSRFVIQRKTNDTDFVTLDDNVSPSSRQYVDTNNIVEGEVYYYRMVAVGGVCDALGHYSDVLTHSGDEVDISLVIAENGLATSKGYYANRTELFWETTGENEAYANRYKIYGREVGSASKPSLLQTVSRDTRTWNHETGDAGVIYEYFIIAERVQETECGVQITQSFSPESLEGLPTEGNLPSKGKGVAYSVGFRIATGIVNGNISYSGGVAVPNVKVVAEKYAGQTDYSLYLDGTDYVEIQHSNSLAVDTAMTLSTWLKPEDLSKFAVVVEKQGSYGLHIDTDGSAYFYIKNAADWGASEYTAEIPASSIKVGNWINLICTYSQATRELKLYINGELKSSEVLPASVTGIYRHTNPLTLGFQYNSGGYFYQGYIDETRLYSRALSEDEVLRESGRITATDAKGLVGYWKMFEGSGKYVYDAAHKGNSYFKNDGRIEGGDWSTDIPTSTQLGYAGYTDKNGNYSIVGIGYVGTGENYNITPKITLGGAVHEFDPGTKTLFIGEGNNVLNNIDFQDISSFQVSGQVLFDFANMEDGEAKSSGSEGVSIFLDGVIELKTVTNVSIKTDSEGRFTVDVPIGEHFLEFRKFGHKFSDKGRFPAQGRYDFQDDINLPAMWDETTHRLVGTVLGNTKGSELPFYSTEIRNNIGQAYFTLTSEDGLIQRTVMTDSLSGKYDIELPPKKYNFSSVKWVADDVDIVNSGDISSVNLAEAKAYQGVVELDSVNNTNTKVIFPRADIEDVISDFRLDTLDLVKKEVHYKWNLNRSGMEEHEVRRVENGEVIKNCCGDIPLDHRIFDEGAHTDYITYDEALPTEIYLIYRDGDGEEYNFGWNILNNEPVIGYDTLGVAVDSVKYNYRKDFIYRVAPSLLVTSAEGGDIQGEQYYPYTLSDKIVNIELEDLRYPAFFSRGDYSIKMKAVELYENKDNSLTDTLAVTDGKIRVNNGIGLGFRWEQDGRHPYNPNDAIELDENGELIYSFKPSDPNITQVDSEGLEHESYTKAISATLEVGDFTVKWPEIEDTYKVYVLGAKAVGNNFVTAGPETVDFVLRDPPGSDSYAYREKGTESTITDEYYNGGFLNSELTGSFGVGGNPSFGIFGWVTIEAELEFTATAGLASEVELGSGGEISRTIHTMETISTSDDAVQVGKSDVFVSKTNNLMTGMGLYVQPIPIEDCGDGCFGDVIEMPDGSQYKLGLSQQTFTLPTGYPTYAVYSESHILNVLIPDLVQLRNSYFTRQPDLYESYLNIEDPMYGVNNDDPKWTDFGQTPTSTNYVLTEEADFDGPSYKFNWNNDETAVDSVRWVNQQIRLWKEALADNEIAKWRATKQQSGVDNISIGSGVAVERSKTSTSSESKYESFESSTSLKAGIDFSVKAAIALKGSVNNELGIKIGNSKSVEETQEVTTGFVLFDSDEDDALSVNVMEGDALNGPIFSTVSGQTSCPYEGEIVMNHVTEAYIDRSIANRERGLQMLQLDLEYNTKGNNLANDLVRVLKERLEDISKQIEVRIAEKAQKSLTFWKLLEVVENPGILKQEFDSAIKEIEDILAELYAQLRKMQADIREIQKKAAQYQIKIADIEAEIASEQAAIDNMYLLKSELQAGKVVLSNPTLQREKPKLSINGAKTAQVFNVPADDTANFTLLLQNESESGDAQYYAVELLDETNPNGLVVKIDGETVNTPREFLVNGNSAIQKILTVERGPFEYEYNNIGLIIHSTCQYDPTSNDQLIADTVYFDVKYLPICTEVEIIKPDNDWVVNSSFENEMKIGIGGYDVNTQGFETIKIQYKPSNSSDWILLETYYRDEKVREEKGADPEAPVLPQNGNTLSYTWNLGQLPDGAYDIRAEASCALAENYSEIYSGIIDRSNPQVFGLPQPSDGILSAGEDIRIKFNEKIDEGQLSYSNIDLRAVVNGGNIRHNTSVFFSGNESSYMETPAVKLGHHAFTIEFYAKREQDGVKQAVISQGSSEVHGLLVAFNSDNQLEVTIAGMRLESTVAVSDNKWHHYAVSYDAEKDNLELFIDGNLRGFNNTFASSYKSNEPLMIAKSAAGNASPFKGYMHEFRIWSKPLSETEVSLVATKKMSGNEQGLAFNWEMEEAHGTIAHEKIRNRHASVFANWAVLPLGYALNLDGKVDQTSMNAPTFNADMSFTVEYWFSTSANKEEVILSTGSGEAGDAHKDGWSIGVKADGSLYAVNNGNMLTTDTGYNDGVWHHFALVKRANANVVIFVDGEEKVTISSENFNGFSGSEMALGYRAWYEGSIRNTDKPYSGSIDELRIWSTARTEQQLKRDRFNKLSGNEPALVEYYPFERYQSSGEVTVVSDNSNASQSMAKVNTVLSYSNGAALDQFTPTIKLGRAVQSIDFSYVLNNDELVITPNVEAWRIERTDLDITVSNVKDMNGNRLQSPATWTAYVNQNVVKWEDVVLEAEVEKGQSVQLETFITNSGGLTELFSVNNIPTWLEVSNAMGQVSPLSSEKIVFTVPSYINNGHYSQDLSLSTDFGYDEKLTVNIHVKEPLPKDWKVNSSDYQYSMNVIAQISFDGVLSRNEEDYIAAFVGGECRGIAPLAYVKVLDNYQAVLSVYGNADGEEIEYRVWSAEEGKTYLDLMHDLPNNLFTINAFYGTSVTPIVFTTNNMIQGEVAVNKGWNWVSFNLEGGSVNNINELLGGMSFANGDLIKTRINKEDGGTYTQEALFDMYSDASGWQGPIGAVSTGVLYKLKASSAGKIHYRGTPSIPDQRLIPLVAGWNFIGFTGSQNTLLADALSNYNASQNDVIKSQNQAAIYDETFGWIGNLTHLEAGKGYMLKSAGAEHFHFRSASSPARIAYQQEKSIWAVNTGGQEHNMTLVASLENAVANSYIGAFVDEKCIGYAKATQAGNRILYVLTVANSEASNELTFKYFDADQDLELAVNESKVYRQDQVLGTSTSPVALTLSIWEGQEGLSANTLNVFPNPAQDKTKLSFVGEGTEEVKILLETANGQAVRTLSLGASKQGVNEVVIERGALPNGVYILTLLVGDKVYHSKLVFN